MAAPGVLVVVVMVSVIRAVLELSVCAQPRLYPAPELVNSVSFYLMAACLFAAAAARLTGQPIERALSVVVPGLYLGTVPPLLDLAFLGFGRCHYGPPGLGGWSWSPGLYTPGQAITAWLSIGIFGAYVAVTTRSLARALLAAAAACGITIVSAVGLSWLVALVFQQWVQPVLDQQARAIGSDYGRGFLPALLTTAQALVAQLALLAARPGLWRHVRLRLLHGLPSVLLVVLGGVLARFRVPPAWGPISGLGLVAVAAVVIADLCLIAVIQNDHFDVEDDRGRSGARITRDDVVLFTTIGVAEASAFALASERVGLPLLLFATACIGYSFGSVRLKKRFPANYAVEALVGASCFVLGVQSRMPLGRPLPRSLLVATLMVFCGWFLFNAFKDYKDIRADVRANTPTLYVLAYRRGVRLRHVHLLLRGLLAAAMLVPLAGLSILGLPLVPLVVSGAVTILPAFFALGRAPHVRTVRGFLWLMSSYVAALALVTAIWGSGR